MKLTLIVFIVLILIAGCYKDVKTGESVKKDIAKEEIKDKFVSNGKLPIEPTIVEEDPLRNEVMDFIKNFILRISFPKVDGYPVRPDKDSFKFVGFTVKGDTYTAVVQFKLNTMKGPLNKQYYFKLQHLGQSTYNILELREDK